MNVLAQATDTTVGEPLVNIAIFGAFVLVTMFVVIRASKKNATSADFFTAGGGFSGPQNGVAIAGDYLSAASFLGITGAIAVIIIIVTIAFSGGTIKLSSTTITATSTIP